MRRKAFLFPLILLWLGMYSHAQLWSGVLSSNRAIDWTQAGVVGGIPNRTTVCSTLNPGATASQIQNAIAACPSGQVVFLNAGTYNLGSGIDFGSKSNVTLRGAGADQTLLVFTGDANCRGFGSLICIGNSTNPVLPTPSATTTWTGGYARGTTSLTVGSTSGMSVGNLLFLDQLDDPTDTGNIFVCGSLVCSDQGQDGSRETTVAKSRWSK